MASRKLKPLTLEGKELAALHDIAHLLSRFEDATKNCLCMARDRAECQRIASEIVRIKAEIVK